MLTKTDLFELLSVKNKEFQIHDHDPLFTVEDSENLRGEIKGAHTKNLFLKNKKNNFYLFSCEEFSKINLKTISKSLDLGNVSFAKKEYLLDLLGVSPGSVTPFALLNNTENNINLYLEDKMHESEYINFHPLSNKATITIKSRDFIEFMIENKKKIHIFSTSSETIVKTYG